MAELERTAPAKRHPIPRRTWAGPGPLSFAQSRLWFLDRFSPGNPVYNEGRAMRLRGPLDAGALERALNAVVARHEALRTVFHEVDGQPVQVVLEQALVRFSFLDLTGPKIGSPAEVDSRLRDEIRRPFHLSRDIPVRATLARLAADDHIFLLVNHHIAGDAWSYGVLFGELGPLYEHYASGRPCRLPELPIQYRDFALWQRERLQGSFLEEEAAYWRWQLDGSPPVLELPADHPRPTLQSYRGATCRETLPLHLTSLLKEVGRGGGATLYMTLLGAFFTLLHRHTGLDDIVVGSPIAARTRVEVEGLVGFFVNTLVLRADLSGDPTFRELLGRVRDLASAAYAHQDLPFEVLVDHLRPERGLSHNPVVQVAFSFANVPRTPLRLGAVLAEDYPVDGGVAKFDLAVLLAEGPRGLSCKAEYSTDLFEAATVARMLRHYGILLEAIAENPDRRLSELPLLTDGERRQICVEWNDTGRDYLRDKCVHELLERQTLLTPEAVAVEWGSRKITYAELNRQADRLAGRLRECGVGPDKLVGLSVERSLDMVIGLVGILKAGGAYLPLDSSYPGERLALMIEDARPLVILTQRSLVSRIPPTGVPVICLDAGSPRSATGTAPTARATAENLAYVMYTSGSTGLPKGVAIPHRAVTRLVMDTDYVRLGPCDVVAQVSNSSFDAATFEVWGALLNGARLVIIDKDIIVSPRDLGRELERLGVTALFLTTALFNAIAHEAPQALQRVRNVLFGGESADVESVRLILDNGRPERLINVYGPTETTTFATWYKVEEVDEDATSVPIGRPIANTTAYLLDRHRNPVPVGVTGELHIGGPGVARGYLNRPELTAERFVPDPFCPAPGARLYKTGDLARYRADGNIEFLGRLDEQVKIRGFRIEPGEIEATLARCPGVKEAVVIARPPRPGRGARPAGKESADTRLVAFVVPLSRPGPSAEVLRDYLGSKLPGYMVPSAFVTLDSLPVTANGKVDRKALPDAEPIDRIPGETLVRPRNDIERRLVAAWERVLGVSPVGIRDDFFELGGHSLLAARLFSEIEKEFGRRLPLAVLFDRGTVEHLARVLRNEELPPPWALLVTVQAGGAKPPFFLVHAAGGNVLSYRNLARLIGRDQPVYALQAKGLDGKSKPFETVEEMATQYLAEVRSVQAEGPYLLGGHCFGGIVAYEMAQQLKAQGQDVALLALLETPHPGHRPPGTLVERYVYHYLNFASYHLGNLLALPPKEKLAYVRERGARAARKIAHGLGLARRKLRSETGKPLPDPIQGVLDANVRALQAYVPRPYPGRLTIIRAARQLRPGASDPLLGWGGMAGEGIEAHEVPGYHSSIITGPHARALAEQLRACLEQAGRSADRDDGPRRLAETAERRLEGEPPW